tara:strand:+ start:27528 stop:27854 length:327 start_codon:yes stop_codon:yes gene_type:complete
MTCGKNTTQDEIDYMYDKSVCQICKLSPVLVNIDISVDWENEFSFDGHICTECFDYAIKPLLDGTCVRVIDEIRDRVKKEVHPEINNPIVGKPLHHKFWHTPKKWDLD